MRILECAAVAAWTLSAPVLLPGCTHREDPSCWASAGEILQLPEARPGAPAVLEPALRNRCDRPLQVVGISLVSLACEGECPELRLVALPPLPYLLEAGERLPIRLQSSALAAAPGRATAVLSVSSGSEDATGVQSWDVEARAVP
ncbi:MAG: hypothetical protein RL653_1269 [Pseudomonadota bacterium]